MKLFKTQLVALLGDYPLEAKVIRKCALLIAFRSAVRFYCGIFRDFGYEDKRILADPYAMAQLEYDSSDALRAPDTRYLRDRETYMFI